MYINASKIEAWAKTKEAQTSLPRLIRRLIHASGFPAKINFPAGESVDFPGWDGELEAENESPWYPRGKSFWEISCQANIAIKASRDFKKRTRKTQAAIRKKAAFVFATAQRWTKKRKWAEEKKKNKQWRDILVFDSDDLEQWLEQNPVVALNFWEELGQSGLGVESLERYWRTWSEQSNPVITAEAFFANRESTRDRFLHEMKSNLDKGQNKILIIKADSVEEATAFVSIVIHSQAHLSSNSLVIKDPSGWQFVDKNPSIRIAVVARPEYSRSPTIRSNLILVIPYAAGDIASYFKGAAGREGNKEIILERPRIEAFEKAIISLGIVESEAKRLASSMGRSWSVFRRHYAINPAIRRPRWIDFPQAKVLSTLCLLGAWSNANDEDKAIVSQLAGRSYEEVEKDLNFLAQVDDAPILRIGGVWKSKSPLELLDIFGSRISSDEFDRYFEIVRKILTAPDPSLELQAEDRFAAQIFGKVRPESEILFSAICDSIVKLSVRGSCMPSLEAANIEVRINALINELLYDANPTRWLSLASHLPSLAEAAPDTFLKAIEQSQLKADLPIAILFSETKESSIMGSCLYAPLLWALENLAWSPKWLSRAVLILARLSRLEIKGNWANSPKSTLVDIFRVWIPQTAADIDVRIAVLDSLIYKELDVAFSLLERLIHTGSDSAIPSSRPRWRDDDAGAGNVVNRSEINKMLIAAADRFINLARGNAQRVARLFEKYHVLDKARNELILRLAEEFINDSTSDNDKEIIRAAVRERIFWHYNYDDRKGQELKDVLMPLEELYEKLTPKNAIVRHKWLFQSGRPMLPGRVVDADFNKRAEQVETLRLDAARQIYSEHGITGIEMLAEGCENPRYVGYCLGKIEPDLKIIEEWILSKEDNLESNQTLAKITEGLLSALSEKHFAEMISKVIIRGKQNAWNPKRSAHLLTLARFEQTTWDIAASFGSEIEREYWASVSVYWFRGDELEIGNVVNRLLEAKRPRTAFKAITISLEKVEPIMIIEMLEHSLAGEEPEGPMPEYWDIIEAIDRLESSGQIKSDRLARLEFLLVPILGSGNEWKAKTIYCEIMSKPEIFTELICMLYKPAHDEYKEGREESQKTAARSAWHLLHHCRRLPGTQPDGSIDPSEFIRYIDKTRELCQKVDRLKVCDLTIGEILAHAPGDTDGLWPIKAARDLLDRPEFEDVRRGFKIGVHNKRGITSRAYDEGGDQERKLAYKYYENANAIRSSHPILAAAIDDIARSYELEGKREDIEVDILKENE